MGVHWPVWGKPRVLEYDQGPEHEAKGIQRGLRLHDIIPKVRAKGHPEHHGTIERLIGTMMRRIHERRGTTFGSVNELGDTEPDRRAFTFADDFAGSPALDDVERLSSGDLRGTNPGNPADRHNAVILEALRLREWGGGQAYGCARSDGGPQRPADQAQGRANDPASRSHCGRTHGLWINIHPLATQAAEAAVRCRWPAPR